MKITENIVLFWTGKDPFSNFYPIIFKHQGILFKWSEQAIMYRKAILFGSTKIASEILKAQTPKQCKDLGRSREIEFNEETWEENKLNIYREVLLDKFNNPKMKEKLLETGDRIIAEASPYDKIWGIGISEEHPHALIPEKWKGQNLLGITLMEVRKIKGESNESN